MHFKLEFGAGEAAALRAAVSDCHKLIRQQATYNFYLHRARLVADEHAEAVLERLVARAAIVGEDEREVNGRMSDVEMEVPVFAGEVFHFM